MKVPPLFNVYIVLIFYTKILNYSRGKFCRKGRGLYKFGSNPLQAAAFPHSLENDLPGLCSLFF